MSAHELVLVAEIFGAWCAGALSKPTGLAIGQRCRRRRLLVRVPVRVRIHADVTDLLEKVQLAAAWKPTITVEQRIRAVHPDWTRAAIAAEADLIRRSGGLS